MIALLPAIALLAAATPQTSGNAFHVENITPGEGPDDYCSTVYWLETQPSGLKGPVPHILEITEDGAFIKVDGKVFKLTPSGGSQTPDNPSVYKAAGAPTVEVNRTITRVDKDPDGGDIKRLLGTLKVTYHNKSQTLAVKGKGACYEGGL